MYVCIERCKYILRRSYKWLIIARSFGSLPWGSHSRTLHEAAMLPNGRSTVSSKPLRGRISPGRWTMTRPMQFLPDNFIRPKNDRKHFKRSVCRTSATFARNSSATESTKSSYGQSTLKSVVWAARNRSCTHVSVTTSKRMKRNAVHLCTSIANPENRSRWTGQVIPPIWSIPTPEKPRRFPYSLA